MKRGISKWVLLVLMSILVITSCSRNSSVSTNTAVVPAYPAPGVANVD